jgi:DNA-binding FrmR family transcriptional regulator
MPAKVKVKGDGPDDPTEALLDRLSRLDGQVQALKRMVGQSDDWKKMLTLAAAIEGAADQVTADLYRRYLETLGLDAPTAAKAREGLELVLRRL